MRRARIMLVYFLFISTNTLYGQTEKIGLYDSCLIVYLNISNCVNCNLLLSKIIKNESHLPQVPICYLLEECYKDKGSRILSEYLECNINESDIMYSDSLVEYICRQSGFNSALFYRNSIYNVIYELSNGNDLALFSNLLFNNIISEKVIDTSIALSNLLHLHILGPDTIVIDQNLPKILMNQKIIPPFKLFVWDIPGLVDQSLGDIDSTDIIFKMEYDNLLKIADTYFLFCSGNQFIHKTGNIAVFPKTIVLQYNDLSDLKNFTHSYILDDPAGCYFDDYSILEDEGRYYILAECGEDQIDPKRYEISFRRDKVRIMHPQRIHMPQEAKNSAGYYCDYGLNYIYFLGQKQIYRSHKGTLLKALEFENLLLDDEYILGFSMDTEGRQYVLVNSSGCIKLISKFVGHELQNEIGNRYVIQFSSDTFGRIVSNCLYLEKERKFVFITSASKLFAIRIL